MNFDTLKPEKGFQFPKLSYLITPLQTLRLNHLDIRHPCALIWLATQKINAKWIFVEKPAE